MEDFLNRITEQSNIIKSRDLTQKDRKLLKEAVKQELVIKLKNGFYCLTDYIFDLTYDFNELVPGGILCMDSAWYYYELTTHIPSEINLALPVGCKIVLPKNPSYKIHYRLNDNYTLGIKSEHYNPELYRNPFNIYDMERCVCDAVKFRNKIGDDICEEVIRSYIRKPEQDFDKLYDYAGKMKVEKLLRQYIEKYTTELL